MGMSKSGREDMDGFDLKSSVLELSLIADE